MTKRVAIGGAPLSAALMAMIGGRLSPGPTGLPAVLIVPDPPPDSDTDGERRKAAAQARRDRRNQKRLTRASR